MCFSLVLDIPISIFLYLIHLHCFHIRDEVQLETNTGEGEAGRASTAGLQVGAIMKDEVILVC